jgi:GNAT superfamily N-acetyltransferase
VPNHALLSIARSHDPLLQLPAPDLLHTWLDTLSRWGYRSVSTSALAPLAATALEDIGFSTAQDLVLLERHHCTDDNFVGVLPFLRGRWPGSRFPSQPVISEILDLDCAAFGDQRQMDHITLREALCATEQSRVFVSYVDKLFVGFVIVGVSDTLGFIQRLAVHPDCRNSGEGKRLVQTALAWIQSKGCASTVVNTEASNLVALRVYENFGFSRMNYRLSVLEMTLSQ